MSKSEVFNMDCIEGMKQYPDKYFDLAIVDPPYGLGIDGQKLSNTNKNPKHNRKAHGFKGWDNAIPNAEYFDELKKVSKNQIIWGGNYFTEFLPPTKAWIFWYKGQRDLTMSDGEMAWTSLNKVTRQITINRAELIKQNTFHPTEKPIKLYDWILQNYATCKKCNNKGFYWSEVTHPTQDNSRRIDCNCNPVKTILDTHLGSGSSRIAAHKGGFDFTGFEIDKEYFDAQEKRFQNYKKQLTLF